MNRVVEVSRQELLRRREALARRVGLSYQELADKQRTQDLPANEWWIWQDIESINYLLGEAAGS